MIADPKSKPEWIEALRFANQTWQEVISTIAPDELDRPASIGEFSVKEIAAHLNGWRELTVDLLDAAAGDGLPPQFPWPDEMSEETEEGTDVINGFFHQRTRGVPIADILAVTDEQFERMRLAVGRISEEDLVTPGRFPWLRGRPLSAVLEGSFEHLLIDHLPEIRAWSESRATS